MVLEWVWKPIGDQKGAQSIALPSGGNHEAAVFALLEIAGRLQVPARYEPENK